MPPSGTSTSRSIQAAEGLGASPLAIGRRIIVPLTAPGVIAGATIVFMNALGYYITPALMGGPGQSMIAMLIADNINSDLNWGLAAALSVVLLVSTLVLFIVFQRVFGLEKLFSGSGSRGAATPFGPSRRRSGGGRLSAAAGFAILLFLIAPIIIVFPMSLGTSPFLKFPPDSYSLRWFESFFSDPKWVRSIWNSLKAASVATPLSVVLGSAAAIGVTQDTPVVPTVAGDGLHPADGYAGHHSCRRSVLSAWPAGRLGSPFTLGLAQTVLCAPYVFITVRAALKDLTPRWN